MTSSARTERLERVAVAAREMPRATPAVGGAGTVHQFAIEAAAVWGLDRALAELDASTPGSEVEASSDDGWRVPAGYKLVPDSAGACEGDDSGWVLAFLHGLHAHLPEDERPTSWMQFFDEQRERIQGAYTAMLAAAPLPPPPSINTGLGDNR